MASLARKLQKLFAGAVSPANTVRNFGGLAANSLNYSNDPDVIQSLAAFGQGWAAAVVGQHSPALQDENSLAYLFSYQLKYLFQKGLPEYLSTETYYLNAWVRDPASGMAYISQQDNNTGNALSNGSYWKSLSSLLTPAFAPQQLCKAWVRFNGNNGTIFSAYNVSGVSRTSTGHYTVNFAIALGDINPVWAGAVGDSGVAGGDSDHLIETAAPSNDGSGHASAIHVGNWASGPSIYQDAGTVMVQVFGN